MLPIIQSLWIGDALSPMEQLCISSFLKNGHSFHLYTYDTVKNIPKDTIVMDANEIIPRNKIFKYKMYDSYAGFANMFRYKLLLEKGGYWVDSDIVCLQPFEQKQAYVLASAKRKKGGLKATNCVMGVSSAGSELMEYCYYKSIEKDSQDLA
ncbi:glycosyltransferase [Candidatus Albibeggiatoa sp. nov. BB20]|uniref:glycosyltransferase n=1 Tax=Candidatus Albibeggiatoa sp. nov. BB20 TaxID=3162723 RepID=UPI0033656E37